jgi:hypothetical protein
MQDALALQGPSELGDLIDQGTPDQVPVVA